MTADHNKCACTGTFCSCNAECPTASGGEAKCGCGVFVCNCSCSQNQEIVLPTMNDVQNKNSHLTENYFRKVAKEDLADNLKNLRNAIIERDTKRYVLLGEKAEANFAELNKFQKKRYFSWALVNLKK